MAEPSEPDRDIGFGAADMDVQPATLQQQFRPGAVSRSSSSPKQTIVRSARQPAAVDGENVAVDIIRAPRGEEHGRAAEIGRLAPAARRDALEDLAVARLVGLQRGGVVGGDVARRDRVDVDALRCPLVGQQLGQPGDARSWRRCSSARGCRPGSSASRRC